MKNKRQILIPTLLTGTMFLALGLVHANSSEKGIAPRTLEVKRANPDGEEIFAPMASYQFQDAANPGLDSMGNYNLTATGSAVSASDGVATFGGGSALYSSAVMNALGNEDFTIKATVQMSGDSTYAIQMFTDYWCNGKGIGVSNWGGQLRAGLDDGANKFGDDHCWSLVLANSSATEHTIVLSVDVGGNANYYCDGALIGTAAVGNDFTLAGSPLPFALGGAVWGDAVQGFGMTGTMKDVRIYKTAVNEVGAHSLFAYNELFKSDVGEQKFIDPMASYQFKDAANPGLDSMGNYNLTATGSAVSASDGVATFGGGSALYSSDVMNALGNEDFTIKATVSITSENSYAIQMFTDYWCNGKGIGVSNWGGQLRAGLDDGANKFGDDHCWSLVLANSSATEHTIVLSVDVGGNANYYCDGVLMGTAAVSNDFTLAGSPLPFALGGAVWGDAVQGFGMTGTLKDVRIYKQALSTKLVDELYALGNAYTSATTIVESVDVLDFSSTIIVPQGATEEEIINGYAPAGKNDIVVNMDNGTQKNAKVQWTGVAEIEGSLYLEGELFDVLNPNEVHAYAKIGVDGEAVEILPLARYNFSSVENMLKDEMGNYDLEVAPKKIYESGEYKGLADANLAVENGAAVFDGSYSLVNKEMAKDLTKATISFDIQLPGNAAGWQSPFSFGRDDWAPHQWNIFEVQAGSTMLRYGACTEIDEYTGHSNIDFENKGESNADWYPPIGELGTSVRNVTLTAGEDNHLKVYLDNELKYDHELPEGFNFMVPDGMFSIGGAQPLGLEFVGKISNFAVYDFAANAQQVRIINAANALKTNAYDGVYAKSYGEVQFEGDSLLNSEVKASDSEATMLAALKDATVPATMSDGSTKNLNVVWTGIEQAEGKYYAVGKVNTLGTALSAVPEAVKVEIEVTQPFAISVEAATNGTVSVDKTEAYNGETVVITVTPAEGYEIDKVYVNGVEVAPVDGVYSFVVNGNASVSATFKKSETPVGPDNPGGEEPGTSTVPGEDEPAPQPAKKGCKGSVIATSAVLSGLALAGIVLVSNKKKEE